jgi:EAL domain-containing protein (putative c-di-GMP-specific phosphodiesterase class I)
VLNELKAMGVRIAIDDFCTGHSSLNYLRQIPLDYVKIDRFFVMNIATSQRDTAIIRSIIALSHSLDLKVIAEGVETEQQFRFLQARQCDEGQGRYFSHPLNSTDIAKFVESRASLPPHGERLIAGATG